MAKLAAIILVLFMETHSRFAFLPTTPAALFYVAAAVIAFGKLFLLGGFTSLQLAVTVLTGLFFWLRLPAMHQVKLFSERNDAAVIHRTLLSVFASMQWCHW